MKLDFGVASGDDELEQILALQRINLEGYYPKLRMNRRAVGVRDTL